MSKAAPGPWWADDQSEGEKRQVLGPDGRLIAIVYGEANANLVAAAPELLESLESLVMWLERHPNSSGQTPANDLARWARAAIVKAKGES